MAKGNPLQEQLLKAGLVKKSKVSEVAREQALARHGKDGAQKRSDLQHDVERARTEKADRDRALAQEQKRKARDAELAKQARQIIQDRKLPRSGELEYRFTADGAVRTLLVDAALKAQLASGALVIAKLDSRYELLPRMAADKVRERDASLIVVDHGRAGDAPAADAATSEDDAYYAQFKVPDDLVW